MLTFFRRTKKQPHSEVEQTTVDMPNPLDLEWTFIYSVLDIDNDEIRNLDKEEKTFFVEFLNFYSIDENSSQEELLKRTKEFLKLKSSLELFKTSIILEGQTFDQKEQAMENLEKASIAEKILAADLLKCIRKQFKEASRLTDLEKADGIITNLLTFLSGGHFVLNDTNAEFYNKWASSPFLSSQNLVSRNDKSSHESTRDQFSIRGPFVKEALFGTKEENEKIVTWIQLESHPTGLRHLIGHLLAYIIYKITGKNIGPYGKSIFTEKNPIAISTLNKLLHTPENHPHENNQDQIQSPRYKAQ